MMTRLFVSIVTLLFCTLDVVLCFACVVDDSSGRGRHDDDNVNNNVSVMMLLLGNNDTPPLSTRTIISTRSCGITSCSDHDNVSSPPRCALQMTTKQSSDDSSSSTNDTVIEEDDTIRVRIWRALVAAAGDELSLRQLGSIVGERKDLKSHLVHVEKQAKTIGNKSKEWRERRGLLLENLDSSSRKLNKKLRIVKRRDRKEIYVKLSS